MTNETDDGDVVTAISLPKEITSEPKPKEITSEPKEVTLSTLLPNSWVFYLYDKQSFKKMASRPNFQAKPYQKLCDIETVNDLIYILQLMEVKADTKNKTDQTRDGRPVHPDLSGTNRINLDMNDYIIMRDGIEPIWEDPKNSNGGTFTIKIPHSKGYSVWSMFVMYMLGETMTYDMANINGITVSYIPDSPNSYNSPYNNPFSPDNSFTYIKIWDGKSNRSKEEFFNILPVDLYEKIKSFELRYSRNNEKPDYGGRHIITKLTNSKANSYNRKERGGFHSGGGRGRR